MKNNQDNVHLVAGMVSDTSMISTCYYSIGIEGNGLVLTEVKLDTENLKRSQGVQRAPLWEEITMERGILGQIREMKAIQILSSTETWIRKKLQLLHEGLGLDLWERFPDSGGYQMLLDREFFLSSGIVCFVSHSWSQRGE